MDMCGRERKEKKGRKEERRFAVWDRARVCASKHEDLHKTQDIWPALFGTGTGIGMLLYLLKTSISLFNQTIHDAHPSQVAGSGVSSWHLQPASAAHLLQSYLEEALVSCVSTG